MISMTLVIGWLRAWGWLSRNWRWVLFPIGLLLLVLGWTRRTNVTVATPVLEGAVEAQRRLADQEARLNAEAAVRRDHEITVADTVESMAVKAVIDQQKGSAVTIQQDPDALNQELQRVGREQRGPSR